MIHQEKYTSVLFEALFALNANAVRSMETQQRFLREVIQLDGLYPLVFSINFKNSLTLSKITQTWQHYLRSGPIDTMKPVYETGTHWQLIRQTTQCNDPSNNEFAVSLENKLNCFQQSSHCLMC